MTKVQLSIDPSSVAPGRVGFAQLAGRILAHHGEAFEPDDLITMSSAAFATYVFDPDINRHETERRAYSRLSEVFSNYGVFESLSQFTRWSMSEVNGLPSLEFFKLIKFEIDHGRPLITYGIGRDVPQVIVGYDTDGFQAIVVDGEGEQSLSLKDIKNAQGDSEVFVNFSVIVRPGGEFLVSPEKQRDGLLRWVVQHGTNIKEFFHESRENYRPGISGSEALGELLSELEGGGERWLREHFASRILGRRAGSKSLARWAGELEEERPELSRALIDAADAFGAAAQHLERANSAAFGAVAEHYAAAHEADARGFRHIADARDHIPSIFG